MSKTPTIKFTIKKELKTELAVTAADRNISVAALIRNILVEYLREKGVDARH